MTRKWFLFASAARSGGKVRYARLWLELLEKRLSPADWTGIGPASQPDSQGWLAGANEAVSGRVTAINILPDESAMYLGEAGGALWKSTNFKTATPTWTVLTDNRGLIDPNTGLGSGTIDIGAVTTANNG